MYTLRTLLKVLCDMCYDITSVDLLTTDCAFLDYVTLLDVSVTIEGPR